MPRYIDADQLLADLQEELSYHPMIYTEEQNSWFDNGLKRVVRIVKSYQSADVVPRAEVAREIDDLRRHILLNENISIKCKRENGEQNEEYWKGKVSALRQIRAYIDSDLKNKYTEEQK